MRTVPAKNCDTCKEAVALLLCRKDTRAYVSTCDLKIITVSRAYERVWSVMCVRKHLPAVSSSSIDAGIVPEGNSMSEISHPFALKVNNNSDLSATSTTLHNYSGSGTGMLGSMIVPGETIHSYYLRFAQMINNMHSIGMKMRPIQVNTKFINHLQPEWRKFVTDVKLSKDLNNTNFDHLYTYLRQHEAYVDENRGNKHSTSRKGYSVLQLSEEGHMARQCTKPKRPRNSAWFKEKAMLAEALESGMVLNEE
ncbi:hypothetical protein Tco_0499820 [Tanacetum coccineum]